MLELKNVTKSLKKKPVLDNINYHFENEIYGLLGPNGAGKTTLIRCIVQLYNLNSGNIIYNNQNISEVRNFNDNIGYLPQKFGLFKELTVFEMLSAMALIKNVSKQYVEEEVKRCIKMIVIGKAFEKRINIFD